jgi:F420-dependent methylenetetrahydromethanopterin dehydrogenase
VFENSVLRRMIGCKREELTGIQMKLYNEELLNVVSSPNNVRIIK